MFSVLTCKAFHTIEVKLNLKSFITDARTCGTKLKQNQWKQIAETTLKWNVLQMFYGYSCRQNWNKTKTKLEKMFNSADHRWNFYYSFISVVHAAKVHVVHTCVYNVSM